MLVFSSKVWEHGGAFPAALDLSSQWPILSGDPALGPGWTFTAGKIVGCGDGLVRRCYARADGAQIMFFESGTDAQYRYFTTTDTSQYRLRQPLGGGAYTMWDGDGNEYQFNWQVSGYDALHPGGYGRVRDYNWGRDGYYLTQLIDPFGNKLTERASSGTSAGGVS
jgi:hypothetical protein